MGFFGDLYDGYDKYAWGGLLPGGSDNIFNDKRSDNEYASVDRSNFNLPGYEQQQSRLGGYLNDVDGRSGPQIGQYQQAGQSGFRGQQGALVGMLQGQAQGLNSVSREQLRQAADSNIGQQQALAATGRGNPALAALAASQNAGRINQGLAGQQAVAGLQERQMALGQLGGVLQGARGQDEQLGMWNAGQYNQRQFGQAQMDQQQIGMNDAARAGMLGQSLQAAGMQQQGGMGYEQNQSGRFAAMMGVPTTGEKIIGGLAGLAPLALGGG